MATNKMTFVRNVFGHEQPYLAKGLFQAGATQAIKRGEILEKTAGGATQWVPIDSDYAMDADVAVAHEEIKSGDRAGYYWIEVPRPGDIWRYALAAANAAALGASLYYSNSETVTVTAGTNIIGVVADEDHYPAKQGHASLDASGDAGTTIKSTSYALMAFLEDISYWETLFPKSL